jgi:hypothetical protein
MASITISVPDAIVQDLVDAMKFYHQEVNVDGLNNGQAAKKIILSQLKREYTDYMAEPAVRAEYQEYNNRVEQAKFNLAIDAEGIT